MKNVKYKLLPVLSLCICMLWGLSITAFALVPDASCTDVLKAEFEVGDSAYYYAREEYTTSKGQLYTYVLENTFVISDTNKYMCFYLSEDSRASSGYTLKVYDNSVGGSYNKIYVDGEYSRTTTSMSSASNIAPNIYRVDTDRTTTAFHTNIPIFPTLELAEQYSQGLVGVDSAVNYKMEVTDTGWVKPFEDIDINDSSIPCPKLSQISHNGFTVINAPDESYMVDVYVTSGVQYPGNYALKLTSLDSALYTNNFGLISDTEGAFTGTIDILANYGCDNLNALNNSKNSFYSDYPNFLAYKTSNVAVSEEASARSFDIWGKPFGKSYIFYNELTTVTASEYNSLSIDKMPLCYTNYKVRFFYYDENSGFHYGPWSDYVYFSDSRIYSSTVYEDNDGNVITTPTIQGNQDDNGNVTITDDTNWIDLNNPNSLFGYIRSVTNNIDATMGNFSVLFGTVFTFIPLEIQSMIWLGIAVMVIIGVIKVVTG